MLLYGMRLTYEPRVWGEWAAWGSLEECAHTDPAAGGAYSFARARRESPAAQRRLSNSKGFRPVFAPPSRRRLSCLQSRQGAFSCGT